VFIASKHQRVLFAAKHKEGRPVFRGSTLRAELLAADMKGGRPFFAASN
jgi:hypothetical protein